MHMTVRISEFTYAWGEVIEAKATPSKSVSLILEGGFTITAVDDAEYYESFRIEPGGIVV